METEYYDEWKQRIQILVDKLEQIQLITIKRSKDSFSSFSSFFFHIYILFNNTNTKTI